jgi:hypothetical protein
MLNNAEHEHEEHICIWHMHNNFLIKHDYDCDNNCCEDENLG